MHLAFWPSSLLVAYNQTFEKSLRPIGTKSLVGAVVSTAILNNKDVPLLDVENGNSMLFDDDELTLVDDDDGKFLLLNDDDNDDDNALVLFDENITGLLSFDIVIEELRFVVENHWVVGGRVGAVESKVFSSSMTVS